MSTFSFLIFIIIIIIFLFLAIYLSHLVFGFAYHFVDLPRARAERNVKDHILIGSSLAN